LSQAKADLAKANANNQLAQSTAKRWEALLKTDSVSKQEADEKESDALAKAALVSSAKANVDRLGDLENFKHVVAPFGGIITARNTDNGALINSGSSTGTTAELFHIADTSKLRIYVQVPESYAPAITPNLKADLYFAEHPGKVYNAILAKTANAIDPVSRTLLVQFEADNQTGELFAGGYTEVHLKLGTYSASLRLPSNTLIFRSDNVQVAVVEPGSNNTSRAILKTVVMGRDFGNYVEIASGLGADDQVILNPPDSITSGQEVKVAAPDVEKPKTETNNEKK
jgi:RND family efflux transporter MFP subunit